ncbi:MAG: hypothetical protein AAGD00_05920 [Planctomycetota bacterium]
MTRTFGRTLGTLALFLGLCVPAAHGAAVNTAAQIESAASDLESGQIVAAESALLTLRRSDLNDDDRARVMELLAAAKRRLENMDRAEVSLQKAELALEHGDLRSTDLHANAARRSDRVSREQRVRASQLLDDAALLRSEFEPTVPAVLDQAIADFEAQRYAAAKAGFATVKRTGVRMDQEQTSLLNRYQDRIYRLERDRGEPFELPYTPMAVLSAVENGDDPFEGMDLFVEAEPIASEPGELRLAMAEVQQPGAAGGDPFAQAARFDGERVLREADDAFEEGRFGRASEFYTRVVNEFSGVLSADDIQYARERLAESNAMIGDPTNSLVQDEINRRAIMQQEATAEFENFVERAQEALAAGDTAEARTLASQAGLTWRTAFTNGLFSEQQFLARQRELDALFVSIDQTEEAQRVAEIERRAADIRREAEDQRVREERERQDQINESLSRLRELQIEQQYEEAIKVAEQVLFLDPTNEAALLMKDVLRDVVIWREWEDIQRRKTVSWAEESVSMQRGLILPQALMDYPEDWPEISFRRGEVINFAESEADRRVLATLETRRIPATFEDAALEDVLSFVATVTNLNIDVDWDALSDIGIEREDEVSLDLREISARVVLDRVLEKASPDDFSRADWAVQDGVLVVASDEKLRENTFIVIYDIRDLLFDINDFTRRPNLDLDQILQASQGGGGGGGGGSIFDDDDEDPDGRTQQEILADLLDIIQTNVDFEGWRQNGGDTGIVQELNGNLIITNTAKNHRQIQRLLRQLREVRSIQITVETRFLQVSQDFFEQVGFDLDIYFNAQNNQYNDAITQVTQFSNGIGLFGNAPEIVTTDIVAAAGAGNGSVTSFAVNPQTDPTQPLTVGFNQTPFAVTAPDPLSIVPVQSGSLETVGNLASTASNFAANFAGALGTPALGLALTYLDDVQIDLLIEATQADQRTVTLQAPRLTFTNGKTANISVQTQQAFVSGLTAVVGTSSVGFNPTVSAISSGFGLSVSGVVSADRRYVTLEIDTTIAQVQGFEQAEVQAVAGGTGGSDGGDIVSASFQLPTVAATQIQTGVTVPDKGTILLGGQRLVTEYEVEEGVPVLSKIPLISRFFTNKAMSKEESTLLILIKPTIIIQREEEDLNFPGLQDQLANPFR